MGKCANKNVKFVSLSPSQATDYLKKKIVGDMTDQDSIFSPAMKTMQEHYKHAAVGLCAHPDLGLRTVCSQHTKARLNKDSYWNDRVTAETCIAGFEYTGSTDVQPQIERTLERSMRYPGHCSFVQITPKEHDELLSSHGSPFEVLTASEVAYRPAPRGMGIGAQLGALLT